MEIYKNEYIKYMKERIIIMYLLTVYTISGMTQNLKPIKLDPPDTGRGYCVMKSLSVRASVREFDAKELSLGDLSDLLWAANGVNRPETGKRTASSAMNAQDIDIYVFMQKGIYMYNAVKHQLDPLVEGDYRNYAAGTQEFVAKAPLICVLVSDISRFKQGEDSLKLVWAAIDAGIVSQNISLYCASVGLSSRPRVTMDQEKIREILKLNDTQYMIMNNTVSYKKE